MELRMYGYRLYPSGKQQSRILNQFFICKDVYNTLLDLNRKLWITNKFMLDSLVLDIKTTCPDYFSQVHSQVLQNISDRLAKAFDSFFNRLKLKKQGRHIKAGFPRFKSRIQSITYPQSGFKFLSNKRLHVSKIGSMPIVLHRLPKGKIKTLTIKHNKAGQWFACFSCEVEIPAVTHLNPTKKVGIDVGLEKFLTDHKNQSIANPRFYFHAEKKLARLQRIMSKRIKGSKNREKARIKMAKQHLTVFNQRTDFLHKLSHLLTKEFAIIAGERLNIKGMVHSNLAKHILDVSWGRFYQMLSYKAVASGGELRQNPKTRGSSCRCSGCGTEVKMPLRKRTFTCPNCGLRLNRDHNAALNHLNDTDGLSGISTPVEIPPLPLRSAKASGICESGTICNT